MITLYGFSPSGNCWKAAQILRFTGRNYRWVEIDPNRGGTRTADFMAMNPFGKIPVVELDDAVILRESNAIMAHFAEGTAWLPPPGLARTRVMEWLFFEQYNHEPYIAVARNIISFLRTGAENSERLAHCRAGGERALDVMERRLVASEWLTESGPTIADLALFAYTHVADEGGFDLGRWPSVLSWVARVRALPGLVPLR
ncbi:MAG TPA: glutathione S-transferase family protein [Acetobacteraceae bacterium]|nr:glutathione S-transferase family protein [Acetobacteraceae bacterium]